MPASYPHFPRVHPRKFTGAIFHVVLGKHAQNPLLRSLRASGELSPLISLPPPDSDSHAVAPTAIQRCAMR
jgi:hypothetical protein